MELDIVVMAAGKGTRMRSEAPKVLHEICGRAMVSMVLESASNLMPDRMHVVVGYKGEDVAQHVIKNRPKQGIHEMHFPRQEPQLGTGHAVLQAVPNLSKKIGTTIVLNGDVPLISMETLSKLYTLSYGKYLVLVTLYLKDPTGYGRIVRDSSGKIVDIVEHKDCTAEQLRINEVYTGMLAAPTEMLKDWVRNLKNDNAQAEYYLTDIVKAAVKDGISVLGIQPKKAFEVMGVNTPEQLAELEQLFLKDSDGQL